MVDQAPQDSQPANPPASQPVTPAAVLPRPRGGAGTAGLSPLELRFPTIEDLRAAAQLRVPRFAYDYVTGGCGENLSRERNRSALDAVRILPRYGQGRLAIVTEVDLFGRSYGAPIGVSPMGLGGLLWPHAEYHLAAAAQAARVPYVLATPAAASIEAIAPIAPDSFWFQLYPQPKDDHKLSFDLMRRARDAGAHVLVATMDTPVRAKRPQDARNRLQVPFRPNLRTIIDIATHPAWLAALLRHGTPRPENFATYLPPGANATQVSSFAQGSMRGGWEWEMLKRVREAWKGPLVIKGIIHPREAAMAARIGADGILVSNHGGRTFDAAPAAIDMLPAITAVAGSMTVLYDSGIRGGLDIARAIACGAQATFAGRPFLYSVAAAGPAGAAHVLELLTDELRQAMGQIGTATLAELGAAEVLHPGAIAVGAERMA